MSVPAMKADSVPRLSELLHGFAVAPDIGVHGIASDSRALEPGFLFLAVGGIGSHGLDYLEEAMRVNIAAIAFDASSANNVPEITGIPTIAVEHLASHLGEIANRYYGHPSDALQTIGITGTNGKTTVAWFIAQCLGHLGDRCAYSGTIGYGMPGDGAPTTADDAGMTSPDVIALQGRLADFVGADATHAALEVSSHALSQNRVDGVRFRAALFTNLTRDHLDYHGDMRSYFEEKARLFSLPDIEIRIINVDSQYGSELALRCGDSVIVVSTDVTRVPDARSYVFVQNAIAGSNGSEISIRSSWGVGEFTLPVVGQFNVENAILALAYLLASGVEIGKACDVMQLLEAPPGRLQRVAESGAAIFIDYAHTPDALESALNALRPHCRGQLWCVFGCGGDRDAGKRPMMAAAASKCADRIVVTTDNPRTENPHSIVADIVDGFENRDDFTIIEDRAAAIAWSIAQSRKDDIILVAGKGHETYQEIGSKRLPFSDYAIAEAAATASGCRK